MKQLAFILVLALLICTCGCQSAGLSSGFSTEPSQDTQATESFEYIKIAEDGEGWGPVTDDEDAITVFRSAKECPDWLVEMMETKVESYSEDYFDDHSVVIICTRTGSTDHRIRVGDVSETEDGGYLFNLEYCRPEGYNHMMGYAEVIVAVNRLVTADDIQTEWTSVDMTNEEFTDYFGNTETGDRPTKDPEVSLPAASVPRLEHLTLAEDHELYGEPGAEEPAIGVFRSAEDCPDWMLELLETKVESYDEDYFEDHSIVVICYETESVDITMSVNDVFEINASAYVFGLRELQPSEFSSEPSYLRVIVAVNRVITEDNIIIEKSIVKLS